MMGPIALAPRWRSALAAFALLAVAAGDDQPCVTDRDVILVVDRSVSITKEGWNSVVLDTLYSFIDSFAPSLESNVRLGIVVFPAFDGKETRDDLSGGAAVAANLTYDADSLRQLVNATVRVDDEAQVGTVCANGKLNDGSCECDPQGAANSTLSWPCGGWHWTPTWQALWLARRMFLDLGDVDATGLVLLAAHGARGPDELRRRLPRRRRAARLRYVGFAGHGARGARDHDLRRAQ